MPGEHLGTKGAMLWPLGLRCQPDSCFPLRWSDCAAAGVTSCFPVQEDFPGLALFAMASSATPPETISSPSGAQEYYSLITLGSYLKLAGFA